MYVLSPPGRGRRPAPHAFHMTRLLTEADLAKMWDGGTQQFSRLKALRYSHHLLAKAVASGKSLMECSRITGHTVARISDIKNDPAFQDLVAYYADELHQVYVDVHQRMAALGTSVLEELQERFENEPEKFSKRELMELFTTMADRSIASAKGGPNPAQGLSLAGGGNGLALQINFVSPQGEASPPIQVIDQKAAQGETRPVEPLGHLSSRQEEEPYYPPGIDIDGEPSVPHTPVPTPSPADIQQARFNAIDEMLDARKQEIESRPAYMTEKQKLRDAFFTKKRNGE